MNGNATAGQEAHRCHCCCCCGAMGRWGPIFWGLMLVLVGVVWLLSNLGILPENWWGVVFPLLLIAWGIMIWLGSRRTGSP